MPMDVPVIVTLASASPLFPSVTRPRMVPVVAEADAAPRASTDWVATPRILIIVTVSGRGCGTDAGGGAAGAGAPARVTAATCRLAESRDNWVDWSFASGDGASANVARPSVLAARLASAATADGALAPATPAALRENPSARSGWRSRRPD